MSSKAKNNSSKIQLKELHRQTARILLLGWWFTAACSLIGSSSSVWPFELCCHFKLQYTIIGLVAIILYLPFISKYIASRRSGLFQLIFLTAAISPSAWAILQLYMPSGVKCQSEAQSPKLKLVQINVNGFNTQYAKALAYIKSEAPDIVSFEEFSYGWEKEMSANLKDYPYRALNPSEEGNFGIAVYSKLEPIDKPQILGDRETPASFLLHLNFDNEPITAIFTHPPPPIDRTLSSIRDSELRGFAKLRHEKTGSFLVAGDCNCTPWSPVFQKLCHEAQLSDSQQGSGVQPSWPVQIFPLRIPIDHFLISKDLCVVERKIGSDVGSDHYPVCITLCRKH